MEVDKVRKEIIEVFLALCNDKIHHFCVKSWTYCARDWSCSNLHLVTKYCRYTWRLIYTENHDMNGKLLC